MDLQSLILLAVCDNSFIFVPVLELVMGHCVLHPVEGVNMHFSSSSPSHLIASFNHTHTQTHHSVTHTVSHTTQCHTHTHTHNSVIHTQCHTHTVSHTTQCHTHSVTHTHYTNYTHTHTDTQHYTHTHKSTTPHCTMSSPPFSPSREGSLPCAPLLR